MTFPKYNSGMLGMAMSVAISFLGSIPPGTTNVITVQLAASDVRTAFFFAIGCLVAEMVYVSICLVTLDRLIRFKRVIKLLEWISLVVLLAMSIASFAAAIGNHPVSPVAQVSDQAPFFSGFILMLINPVQIPFWLGWTAILVEKEILLPSLKYYILYVVGAGIGSMGASALFIKAGDYLFTKSSIEPSTLHYVIGFFFLISAIVQAFKMRQKRLRMRNQPLSNA